MAAPVAMIGYGLLGTSHQLVVSATTATSAVSAATVGPLAGGDAGKFAALSAMLALVTGIVLVLGGLARFGAVADLVSKPVMTGFLFGLGLTIALAQLPSLLGVDPGEGNFFPRLWDLLGDLGDVDVTTLAVGGASLAVLLRRAAASCACDPVDAARARARDRGVRDPRAVEPRRGRGRRHPARAAGPRHPPRRRERHRLAHRAGARRARAHRRGGRRGTGARDEARLRVRPEPRPRRLGASTCSRASRPGSCRAAAPARRPPPTAPAPAASSRRSSRAGSCS